jgi:hypothetical protein
VTASVFAVVFTHKWCPVFQAIKPVREVIRRRNLVEEDGGGHSRSGLAVRKNGHFQEDSMMV